MVTENANDDKSGRKEYKVLVAVDFSPYSTQALRRSKSIMGRKPDRILVLHVIDHEFIKKCVTYKIGTEDDVKKILYLQAKAKLDNLLHEEGIKNGSIEELICDGIPFMEINKIALQRDVDMVILGNRGASGDMQTIFFGSTAERVLRFMKRPVLCVSIEEDRK